MMALLRAETEKNMEVFTRKLRHYTEDDSLQKTHCGLLFHGQRTQHATPTLLRLPICQRCEQKQIEIDNDNVH